MASLKDFVKDTLLSRIVYLQYEPGCPLNESEICKEMHVSNTPVREALLEIKAYGLIDIVPRSGTYVADIDLVELKDLYLVKQTMEGLVAELATTRITPASISLLETILSNATQARIKEDTHAIVQADREFHEILYRSTYNKPLQEMLRIVEYRCLRGWYYFMKQLPELEDSINNLEEVKNALKVRNSMASRKSMEAHVGSFIDILRKVLI